MKVTATGLEGRNWLFEQLSAAGGIAGLAEGRSIGALFYFADRAISGADFESGQLMSTSKCDNELEEFAREQNDLIGMFQNSWSQIGDLNDSVASAATTFTYQGHYYHFSKEPGSLSIAEWRGASVTQFGVIFLMAQSPELKAMLTSRAETRVLSDADANAISFATRFAFVSAFDGESWLGAAFVD